MSAGGATNVVAMTIRSTAPNTASGSTPERRPMSAKMSPTSPRGTIPTPTTSRRNGAQGAAQPAASLPTMAITISAAGHEQRRRATRRSPGSSSARSTDAPTLTKKIGAKIEPTGWTSCSMVSN